MTTVPKVDDFDFVQLIIYDVHGFPKGRMMAKSRMAEIIKNGLGTLGGLCFLGIGGKVSPHSDFYEMDIIGSWNMKPLLQTLKPCPKLGQGKFRVGQVLCCMEHMDGRLDTSTPRTAAEIQIERLQTELGLTIKSAFEMEFIVRESGGTNYFGHVINWSSTCVLEECQAVLFDLIQELSDRDIAVDSIQTENGPGQFELTLNIAEGIESADRTIECKNFVKTFFKTRGYDATFMAKVDPHLVGSNSFHFNHSVWTSSGENAFLDASKANKLSDLGCHWLAGLLKHAPAMTAFCNPTISCYRQIGDACAPTHSDWSCQGKQNCFKLKVEGGDNVFLENRLPTSASNPYLVMICTIAAGIDGVKRKLPLPKSFLKTCVLPTNLESALKALEADTVLTDAMGAKLVEYFIHSKRTFELQEFAAFGNLTEEEKFEREQKFYFINA